MKNALVSLDLETTGLDPEKDKIIEFGAVKFNLENNEKESLQFFINPGIKIPQIITHITNIKDEDLEDAPAFEEKKEEIKNFIEDSPIVGHNIKFDTNFLRQKGIELKNPEYDTHELASIIFPSLNSYSLEVLTQILNLQHKEKHRALDDAKAAADLFIKLTEEFKTLNPDLIERIKKLLNRSQWPLKNVLLSLTANEKSSQEHQSPSSTQSPPPSPQEIESFEQIGKTQESTIFELPAPHTNLIKFLAKNTSDSTYISLPFRLFRQLEKDIPDTVAKIDMPSNYISPQRLEEFSEAEVFEDHEISALIKYLIWIQKTRTGLLHEVRIIGNEKNTIHRVNINEDIIPPEQEPFFKQAMDKDSDSPAICTHEYLIEHAEKLSCPQIPSAIIIDIENFHGTLSKKHSTYLKAEFAEQTLKALKQTAPECAVTDSLISKCTIFFGLIGMIFNQHKTPSNFSQICEISDNLLNDKNWISARETTQNLIEISVELGEIKNQKTAKLLRDWKKILESLDKIFNHQNPDETSQNDAQSINCLNKNMTWIEEDFHGDIVLRKIPINISEETESFLKNFENYKIIGNALDIEDKGKFIKDIFDLPQNLPFISIKYSPPDTEIHIITDINERDGNQLPSFFTQYLSETEENIAIICNSKAQMEYLTLKLGQKNIPTLSQTAGSIAKLNDKFQETPISPILLTPYGWKDFSCRDKINTLFIQKLPFDPPSASHIIAGSQNREDPFNEFQVPRAILNLKKIIEPMLTQNNKKIVILDDRIIIKGYGKQFMEALKSASSLVQTSTLHQI